MKKLVISLIETILCLDFSLAFILGLLNMFPILEELFRKAVGL